MKKILLIALLIVSFFQGFSQTGNDSTKYIYYRYTYGNRIPRYWANQVLEIPQDTTFSKYGVARIGSVFYIGNGAWWTAASQQVAPLPDGIISGGIVTWTGTGLVFNVSRTVYVINGVQYVYPGGTVTLNSADPTNPRQSSIVVTTSSTVTSIDGTAQTSPEVPTPDQATQLFLTSVLVGAAATTPTQVGQVIVRDVNYAAGEWFLSRTATIDSIYTTNPFHSTLSVRLTAATSGQFFQYNSRASAPFSKSTYNTLLLYVRNNSVLNAARSLSVRLFNGNVLVGNQLALATYGYIQTLTGSYQTIAIPMSDFKGGDAFTAIRITNTGTGGTLDVQFDYVQLQSGIIVPPPPTNGLFGRTDISNATGVDAAFNNLTHDFNFGNGNVYIGAPDMTKTFRMYAPDGTTGKIQANSGVSFRVIGGNTLGLQANSTSGFLLLDPNSGLLNVDWTSSGNTPYGRASIQNPSFGVFTWDLEPVNGALMRIRNLPNGTPDSLIGIETATGKLVRVAGTGGAGVTTAALHDTANNVRDEIPVLNEPITTTGSLLKREVAGSYTTFTDMFFRWDLKIGTTTNAPANGAVDFINTSLKNKSFDVYKNGVLLDSTSEYTFNNSSGTVTFSTPLATNDLIKVRGTATIYNRWPALEAPPAAWTDLTLGTVTSISAASHIWTSSTTAWGGHGLDAHTLTGDGKFRAKYSGSSDDLGMLGWNTSNVDQDFTGYEYGAYVAAGGALTTIINGSPGAAVASLSTGDYFCLSRTGSTIIIQTSPDGVTWTTQYTFSATTSATLYFNINVYQTGRVNTPQYL